jgi:hypothetical protein
MQRIDACGRRIFGARQQRKTTGGSAFEQARRLEPELGQDGKQGEK